MKRRFNKRFEFIFNRYVILCLLFPMVSLCCHAQTDKNYIFDYPIRPGDGVWSKLSVKERIDTLQIPERYIHNISTKDLLNVSLDFPYLMDIFFADNLQKGFEGLLYEFNGFKELMSRKDLLETAISKIEEMTGNLQEMEKASNAEKGNYSFKWFVLEMMLAQDAIADKFNKDHLKLCINNLTTKKNHPSIFGGINNVPTYLLLAKRKLMGKSETIEDNKYRNFIDKPLQVDNEIINGLEETIERIRYEK